MNPRATLPADSKSLKYPPSTFSLASFAQNDHSSMATPLLLMSSGQTASEDKTGALFRTEEIKPEAGRTRGRKSSRRPNPKKQPQRGLGVAQLERLRLQEPWKKITEIPQVHSFNHLDPQRHQYMTPILPCTDQVGSVPLQFGAPLYCAPTSVVNGGCGGLVVQRVGNGRGFGGLYYGGSSGMGAVVMGDQVGVDAYGGIGDPDPRVFVGTVFETSKELSSMPKMHSGPPHCDVCFKKKCFNGRNVGFNGVRENYSEISPVTNSSDFMGSNMENIPNLTGETCNFGGTAPSLACRNLDDQGVEVVAVHRKGNSRGGSVLMEYEFFPGRSGRGTSSKALEEASVAVDGEASYLTSAAYSSTSNSVDLSLKLSF